MRLALFAPLLLGCYYDVDPLAAGAPADLHIVMPDLSGDAGACAAHHAGELAEAEIGSDSSGWSVAPVPKGTGMATLTLDPARVAAGAASLRLDTNASGAGFVYPGTRDADFDLSEQLFVSFSMTADDSAPANDPGWKGGEPHFFLISSVDDYYEYVPPTALVPRVPGAFVATTVPIAGGNGWVRNLNGTPDLHHVRYLAWTFSTWGAGFTVWLDDVQVGPDPFPDCTRDVAIANRIAVR